MQEMAKWELVVREEGFCGRPRAIVMMETGVELSDKFVRADVGEVGVCELVVRKGAEGVMKKSEIGGVFDARHGNIDCSEIKLERLRGTVGKSEDNPGNSPALSLMNGHGKAQVDRKRRAEVDVGNIGVEGVVIGKHTVFVLFVVETRTLQNWNDNIVFMRVMRSFG